VGRGPGLDRVPKAADLFPHFDQSKDEDQRQNKLQQLNDPVLNEYDSESQGFLVRHDLFSESEHLALVGDFHPDGKDAAFPLTPDFPRRSQALFLNLVEEI